MLGPYTVPKHQRDTNILLAYHTNKKQVSKALKHKAPNVQLCGFSILKVRLNRTLVACALIQTASEAANES